MWVAPVALAKLVWSSYAVFQKLYITISSCKKSKPKNIKLLIFYKNNTTMYIKNQMKGYKKIEK